MKLENLPKVIPLNYLILICQTTGNKKQRILIYHYRKDETFSEEDILKLQSHVFSTIRIKELITPWNQTFYKTTQTIFAVILGGELNICILCFKISIPL